MAAGHSELTYIWLCTDTISRRTRGSAPFILITAAASLTRSKKKKEMNMNVLREVSLHQRPHGDAEATYAESGVINRAGAPSPVWPLCILQTRTTKEARRETGGSYSRCQECGTPGGDEQVTAHGRLVTSPKHESSPKILLVFCREE